MVPYVQHLAHEVGGTHDFWVGRATRQDELDVLGPLFDQSEDVFQSYQSEVERNVGLVENDYVLVAA